MKSTQQEASNVLVAMLRDKSDFSILERELWYRIPVESAPPLIRERRAKWLAFYLPAVFGDSRYQIRHYGKLSQISEAGRAELFPNESPHHPKANRRYFKIKLESLKELPEPFLATRGHRNAFFPTTERKFFHSPVRHINYLFNNGPLEDLLFKEFVEHNIPVERQWRHQATDKNFYFLDFAIFCRKNNIDVECDGNTYHDIPERVHYDKDRNNNLTSHGWSVLRYTTDRVTKDMGGVMKEIYKTIRTSGGLTSFQEPKWKYGKDNSQLTLWS